MKVCERCGGVGCSTACVMCASCFGTGLVSLGPESADRYEAMKQEARAKAGRLGWTEEVWVGQWPESQPRKILRVISTPRAARRRSA